MHPPLFWCDKRVGFNFSCHVLIRREGSWQRGVGIVRFEIRKIEGGDDVVERMLMMMIVAHLIRHDRGTSHSISLNERYHTGWTIGKVHGRISTADIYCSTSSLQLLLLRGEKRNFFMLVQMSVVQHHVLARADLLDRKRLIGIGPDLIRRLDFLRLHDVLEARLRFEFVAEDITRRCVRVERRRGSTSARREQHPARHDVVGKPKNTEVRWIFDDDFDRRAHRVIRTSCFTAVDDVVVVVHAAVRDAFHNHAAGRRHGAQDDDGLRNQVREPSLEGHPGDDEQVDVVGAGRVLADAGAARIRDGIPQANRRALAPRC